MDLWALQYCDSITELTTKSIDYTVYPVYRFIVPTGTQGQKCTLHGNPK